MQNKLTLLVAIAAISLAACTGSGSSPVAPVATPTVIPPQDAVPAPTVPPSPSPTPTIPAQDAVPVPTPYPSPS